MKRWRVHLLEESGGPACRQPGATTSVTNHIHPGRISTQVTCLKCLRYL